MTRLVVVLGFLVSFAAGLAVGVRSHPAAAPPTSRPSRYRGWLAAELNLTPAQQEELNRIWSDTAWRGGREQEERRRQLRRERDEAIVSLVSPADKPRYDQILKNYSDQLAALDHEFRGSYQASVERTKQILTPEQRTKYEELLRRHDWSRRDDRAATRTATQSS